MNLLKIGKTLIFVCNKGLSIVTVTFTQKLHSGSAYPNFHQKTQEALERQNGLGEERITPTLSLSLSLSLVVYVMVGSLASPLGTCGSKQRTSNERR